MKKLILLFVVSFLIGCVGVYHQVTHASRQPRVGMSVPEFQRIAGDRAVVVLDSVNTIYKVSDRDLWSGAVVDTRLFYFDATGRLFKIAVEEELSSEQIANK